MKLPLLLALAGITFLLASCQESIPVADDPNVKHTPPAGSYAAKALDHYQQAHGATRPAPGTGTAP